MHIIYGGSMFRKWSHFSFSFHMWTLEWLKHSCINIHIVCVCGCVCLSVCVVCNSWTWRQEADMETSDSNNKDAQFIFLRVSFIFMCKEVWNTHVVVSFDVEHNVETWTWRQELLRVELIWRLFHVHFSPLSNTLYEWVEWMWRMSKRSRVDVENEQAEWMWTIS